MKNYLTRLTPNYNKWEKPSGSTGKCGAPEGPPYEGRTALGWEEWLLHDFHNPIAQLDGYCYGFIQAFYKKNLSIKTIDKLHLYTRVCNGKTSKTYYVGYIANLEILVPEHMDKRVIDKMTAFCNQVPRDLNQLDVHDYENDFNLMRCEKTLFNVRYKPVDVHVVDFNFMEREIKLPHGWYRFNLYDLNKSPGFFHELNNF
jgi:hypothetical protein